MNYALESDNGKPTDIALVLSGGGFRATLFHLGVVDEIRKRGVIGRVKHIIGVSGGAILAAYVVSNWKRVSDLTDNSWKEQLLEFVSSDMRGRVTRELLANLVNIPWKKAKNIASATVLQSSCAEVMCEYDVFSADLQAKLVHQYERLFGREATLISLPDPKPQGSRFPFMYLTATNYSDGRLLSFSQDGLANLSERRRDSVLGTGHLPLATCVAASAAFPPFLPAVPLLKLGTNNQENLYLGDGGITDNLGIKTFMSAVLPLYGNGANLCTILSDAEPAFDESVAANGQWRFIERGFRASELQMTQMSIRSIEQLRLTLRVIGDLDMPLFHVPLRTDRLTGHHPDLVSNTCWKYLQHVRTDLDGFSAPLCDALQHAGTVLAAAVLPQKPGAADHSFSFEALGLNCGERGSLPGEAHLKLVNDAASDESADRLNKALSCKRAQVRRAICAIRSFAMVGVASILCTILLFFNLRVRSTQLETTEGELDTLRIKSFKTGPILRDEREERYVLRPSQLEAVKVTDWWSRCTTQLHMEAENPPVTRFFFQEQYVQPRRLGDGLLIRAWTLPDIKMNSANRWMSADVTLEHDALTGPVELLIRANFEGTYSVYSVEVFALLDTHTPAIPPNRMELLTRDSQERGYIAVTGVANWPPMPLGGDSTDHIWRLAANVRSDHLTTTNHLYVKLVLDDLKHLSRESMDNWKTNNTPVQIQILEIRVFRPKAQ